MDYIDTTYLQYSLGKFGTKKAWHITTKLALSLIHEVGKPRKGTINSFCAGNSHQINSVMTWAMLRSLDVMGEIRSLGFKNHPVVSTELVKFLSMNTSVDTVDRLKEQAVTFAASIKQLKIDVVEASKTASTNGNKVVQFESKVNAFDGRIKKLERKD